MKLVEKDDQPFKERIWKLGHGRELLLGTRSLIMGILNTTPDSFSDGGDFLAVSAAVKQAKAMVNEGADIIDIGGESTRPGASPVTAQEEQDRVLPVIEQLAKDENLVISIDTYRASTARMAVEAGAHIINDVWGFQKDEDIAAVASQTHAGCCLMHTGRERTKRADVIEDQIAFLTQSVSIAKSAGVSEDAIVLDPGFGFGKDANENIDLLARMDKLNRLGYPLLAGTSRKRFIGYLTGRDAALRDVGTAATNVVARMKGASVFRVHDVAKNKDALAIADAIIAAGATA